MNFVLAFSCGRESEYATCARVFFRKRRGKISVFKHNRIRVDGAWVRVAWNCIVGLFCEAFWPSFCASFQQPIKEAIAPPKQPHSATRLNSDPVSSQPVNDKQLKFFRREWEIVQQTFGGVGTKLSVHRGRGGVTRQIYNLVINLQNRLKM